MTIENLDLSNCRVDDVTVSMCAFLRSIFGENLTVKLVGRIFPDRIFIKGKLTDAFEIGNGVQFRNVEFKIRSSERRGDKTALTGDVYFKRTEEQFRGNLIIFEFLSYLSS